MMNGPEKSDPAIVAMKPTNQSGTASGGAICGGAERGGAGGSEGRGPRGMRTSKARAGHRAGRACHRRWNAYGKSQAIGRRRGSPALFHHISTEHWKKRSTRLRRTQAPGVDRLTWKDYEADLERNLEDLHGRVQRGAYRALPSRRVYIPKPDGRQRPLAVAALEDKIVQRAVAALLNAIYEEDFLGFSYGFRPGRGAHDALCVGIHSKR